MWNQNLWKIALVMYCSPNVDCEGILGVCSYCCAHLGIRWRWVCELHMPVALTPRKDHLFPLYRIFFRPHAWSVRCEEMLNLFPLSVILCLSCGLATIPTALLWLLACICVKEIFKWILCLLDRTSFWKLSKERPTWCHLLYYFFI